MSQLVTIFGGSGFVGRYIARRMAKEGWRVRVAVRRPNEAGFVRTYGVVGQVEPVLANIRDDASVAAAVAGADAVVNCVGILAVDGKNTFESVQADGAARVARTAAEAGVKRFVQISAIGADSESASVYARTKAEGEAAVREALPEAVILRPSIIFGAEDGFFNRFADMARFSPFLPLIGGGKTRFQPVFVGDVAEAALKALESTAARGQLYELGGPTTYTFKELMAYILKTIRRPRLLLPLPFPIAHMMGLMFEMLAVLPFVQPLITRDQVTLLKRDNVVSEGALGLSDLGIEPETVEAIVPSYLVRYRKGGQFSEPVSE